MRYDLRYLGRSQVTTATTSGGGASLNFSPNLARPQVAFHAEIQNPVRFREAISALHSVVINDQRFHKKDKAAYLAWKKDDERRLRREAQAIQSQGYAKALNEELNKLNLNPLPDGLTETFREYHQRYWKVRRQWASDLIRNDMELFRHLIPCDPVVTVAPDTVYFECFAKDESSYGCLFVDRDAFRDETGTTQLGTTNVDYSLDLYAHFQTLRSYNPTRLHVDPTGFEVEVEGHGDFREEKIDLPPSWLRGFGQLQAAMALPSRTVRIPTSAVYNVLAHLSRHREKKGPRCIRFELKDGAAPRLTLEPWGTKIDCHGTHYQGEDSPEGGIKVWGRRRLTSLSRILPLTDFFEVHLLGSGLPSIWVAHMGEMRFVLALSGWSSNDWTSGANLDLLAGSFTSTSHTVARLERHLATQQFATLAELTAICPDEPRNAILGSLHTLAKHGQLVYDFATKRYRYRQVMPFALSSDLLGPQSPELTEAQRFVKSGDVKLTRADRQKLTGSVGGTRCETTLNSDGRFVKGKCSCSFYYKNKLRKGPCRHLLALKLSAEASG